MLYADRSARVPSLFLGEIRVPPYFCFMLNLGLKVPVLALRCLSDCFLRRTRTVNRFCLLVSPPLTLSQESWTDRSHIPPCHRKSHRNRMLPLSALLTAIQKIGAFIGCLSYIYYWNPRYMRYAAAFAPNPVPPEYRLEMATWATVPYAVAFFWFGWVVEIPIFGECCS